MKVLVPRPGAQAEPFAAALRAEGLEPVVAPVTRIEAVDPGPLDAALARSWQWIVFTSANAVAAVAARGRPSGRIAAVGDRTAAALRELGLAVDVIPPDMTGAGLARALAAADELAGAEVLYPRAEDGRDEAVLGLQGAGAKVSVVPVYRSVPLSPEELAPLLSRLRAGEIEAVALFAPSQIAPLRPALDSVRWLCAIGPTTAEALVAAGLRADVIAPSPSAEALARAIAGRPLASGRRPR